MLSQHAKSPGATSNLGMTTYDFCCHEMQPTEKDVLRKCDPEDIFYPACMILLSSSSVQKSISKSSPMRTGGICLVASVFFCSSVMFAHPLLLILNTSSILLPIREVQRTQNDLFMRLRGRVYETREQKSHICNNRTNYEIFT